MPKSNLIGDIAINLCNGTEGVIHVCHRLYKKGELMFRATCRHSDIRVFGCLRLSIVAAVEQLVLTQLKTVSTDELRRVTAHVTALSHTKDVAMRRCQIDAVPLVVMDNKVKVYHHTWGLFGDGSEMPATFRQSQARWKNLAAKTGAIYHCWGPVEVETLIKEYFPTYGRSTSAVCDLNTSSGWTSLGYAS